MNVLRWMAVTAIALCMTGCAAQQRQQERQAQFKAISDELNRQNELAKSGAQTWVQAYENASRLGYQQQNPVFQEGLTTAAAFMMPYARAADAGQLSYDQLHDVQMVVGARLMGWMNRQIAIQEQQIRANEQAESQRFMNALSAAYIGNAIANPPQYRAPVSCTTNKVGNFLQTNCY